ncbi:hypothetical protein CRYUN_Cryun19dG0005200 [Craigia yunnanensis]
MGTITESLGVGPNHLGEKMEDGMQVMTVNRYPPCPEPDIALGMPPHSDSTCLTIVLQSSPGLEILDTEDGNWKLSQSFTVPYRGNLNCERTRISIATLHSSGMDDKMETAKELVDELHPERFKASSFWNFLDFLATNDNADGKSFIDTLKIKT